MATNWRQIADLLASRLMHFAHCESGHISYKDGLDDGCPFCADIQAYEIYRAAGGTAAIPEVEGTAVDIAEISNRTGYTGTY